MLRLHHPDSVDVTWKLGRDGTEDGTAGATKEVPNTPGKGSTTCALLGGLGERSGPSFAELGGFAPMRSA